MQGKRQRYIIAVCFLTALLYFSSWFRLGQSGFIASFFLGLATGALFFIANFQDIRGSFSISLFVLPFFYSFSCGIFYSLVPDRMLTRIIMTSFYGLGLYSLFLSQNIFTVASIRTIALLASAKTVSLVLTIISYFFLINVTFSLHTQLITSGALVFAASFFLIHHSLWVRTLNPLPIANVLWTTTLASVMLEIGLIMWFWPSSPTIVALFLTGIFYTIVGLTGVWFEKRLFRSVLWEYIWVSITVFFILLLFTSW